MTIEQAFAHQRSAFATRLDRLNRLPTMIERIAPDVDRAVSDDSATDRPTSRVSAM